MTYTVTDASETLRQPCARSSTQKTEPRIILNGDENMVFTARTISHRPRLYGDGWAGERFDFPLCRWTATSCHISRGLSDSLQPSARRGESVSVTRSVTVIPANRPDVVNPDGKTPTSHLTTAGLILKALTLAAYNVKATFRHGGESKVL